MRHQSSALRRCSIFHQHKFTEVQKAHLRLISCNEAIVGLLTNEKTICRQARLDETTRERHKLTDSEPVGWVGFDRAIDSVEDISPSKTTFTGQYRFVSLNSHHQI